jgi:hypothetical protein
MKNKEQWTPHSIHTEAHAEGMRAGRRVMVKPMVVAYVLGGEKHTQTVEAGVCGFAKVNIKPARGKFVSYLKSERMGRPDSYMGGYNVYVHEFGQSLTRKEAYAHEYARVLRSYGLTACSYSHMD